MTDLERKKIDGENAIKWKIKKEKIKLEKLKRQESINKIYTQPSVLNNMVVWLDISKVGNIIRGSFKGKDLFEIRRGTYYFSLRILNNKIISEKKNFNSIELIKLQEIANNILKKNIKNLIS